MTWMVVGYCPRWGAIALSEPIARDKAEERAALFRHAKLDYTSITVEESIDVSDLSPAARVARRMKGLSPRP